MAVVWAELDANPWMFLPTLFAAGPLGADLALPGPGEPGPFSLADPQHTVRLLEECGFGEVAVVRLEHPWVADGHAAVASISQMLSIGPLGPAWASADDDARRTAVDAVLAGCEDHRHGDDWHLPAAALAVSAVRA